MCAVHYQVTVYVAEFWNTISNLSMIIPPLYGVWNARKYALETRFFVSHLSLLLGESIWVFLTVLRIRDVYPGSEFFPSWIHEPHGL
jgi:dihydroceramidase